MTADDLEQLAREHQSEIYRYLRYLGADTVVAEDLVQETLLAAFSNGNEVELLTWDRGRQSAWLRGVARNQWLMCLRKTVRRREKIDTELVTREMDERDHVWTEAFLRAGDGYDYVEALRACLQRLSPRQREVVESFYGKDESREVIGTRLGMTIDGVKTMLRRMRAGLAECIRTRLALQEGPHVQ